MSYRLYTRVEKKPITRLCYSLKNFVGKDIAGEIMTRFQKFSHATQIYGSKQVYTMLKASNHSYMLYVWYRMLVINSGKEGGLRQSIISVKNP